MRASQAISASSAQPERFTSKGRADVRNARMGGRTADTEPNACLLGIPDCLLWSMTMNTSKKDYEQASAGFSFWD